MKGIPLIKVSDYQYPLPEDRIAVFPLPKRDDSKLLVYKNGNISENRFFEIASLLEPKSVLVFNDSKVIQARLYFKTEAGAAIEVFCLEPHLPEKNETEGSSVWKCMVGNAKRWKNKTLVLSTTYGSDTIVLKANLLDRYKDDFLVTFHWEPSTYSFDEVLGFLGVLPLPPYLSREATEEDHIRYQTIYAKAKGSVAAPTAGLHFTEQVFQTLAEKEIGCQYLTLHVGAGTFKPVKSETIEGHDMHDERVVVSNELINKILQKENQPLVAVGTTSLRSLESLYWLGVLVLQNQSIPMEEFVVSQWIPYLFEGEKPSMETSLQALVNHLEAKGETTLSFRTHIIIVPGYEFQVVDAIITNFHQPESTLMLLVAAFIGNDWQKVYTYALENQFRFLSFGDSSLLFRNPS